ncbi:uncharacterized protein AB675_6800 [Cyphellophora attinorum]|uniref:Uncharacterized protein n=1 Tax=Cyphellophora attinorum TaxID=1664694 RepID=A0A0N1HYE4_9EURO|nr:uncharacterized protein AB675_6800 [Phialophora attinorum]KPI43416.1 hypothetical protein AB675_6800 [Phialophora attinorum]
MAQDSMPMEGMFSYLASARAEDAAKTFKRLDYTPHRLSTIPELPEPQTEAPTSTKVHVDLQPAGISEIPESHPSDAAEVQQFQTPLRRSNAVRYKRKDIPLWLRERRVGDCLLRSDAIRALRAEAEAQGKRWTL